MWVQVFVLVLALSILAVTIVTYVQGRDTLQQLTALQADAKTSSRNITASQLSDRAQRDESSRHVQEQLATITTAVAELQTIQSNHSWLSKKMDEILEWTRSKRTTKHVVNYEPFERLCISASLNPVVLDTFRRTPELIDMLEHVHECAGPDFLRVIEIVADQHGVEIPWEHIMRNDQVGSPKLATYVWKDSTISICPTTLRYVMLALQSLVQMKNSYPDAHVSMIEIGSGYGGQCAMFFKLAPLLGLTIDSYTILDLDGPRLLQRAYLTTQLEAEELERMQFLSVSNSDLRTMLKPKSFLFSAYAYSEIHHDVQRLYNATLQGFPSHGRVVWNSVELPETGFFQMIGLESWQITIQPEFPQTAPHNIVYVF